MNNTETKKILLSARELEVTFRVRGRSLCAIRGVSMDFFENESVAIVGESGSGKSVLTKAFSGMLDSNGAVSGGEMLYYDGDEVTDLAKIKKEKEWCRIRGGKIATVFQDPMTSLDPIMTIGRQVSDVIRKRRGCSAAEARLAALDIMKKVGIDDAQRRFNDYPFQYSGGMRQRIVIAIALCCAPRILICDEPTTALDVTVQAQILGLIKELQRELGFTVIFITHDLGVVANIADRVAVMYAGQIVEIGQSEEIFYDPRHPYTWALLSSLPQLCSRDMPLYSIEGTPPSLYREIKGDAFAPRNPYAMKIDTLAEPPMFRVSDTHYAKTWLLDKRAPKLERPKMIQNIHQRLMKEYRIEEK